MLKRIAHTSKTRPLCVDLDGTLLRGDVLAESVVVLLKKNPLYLLLLPLWLLRGKAALKQEIASRVDLDPALLPYNARFVAWLRRQKAAGREIILVTASNDKFATAIARHLRLFDAVIASDERANLKGRRKLERLVEEFGEKQFDYAANGRVDIPVWRSAARAIVVNPQAGVRTAAQSLGNVDRLFDDRDSGFMSALRAMRLHQWLKNLLVFVPLIMAHRMLEPALVLDAAIAFLAFSLCASSVYLLNDLVDLPADRQHPTKRNRPLASGNMSIALATGLIPLLLASSLALSLLLPSAFLLVIGGYYLATVAYSFYVKRTLLFDVIALAGLFTSRIIAGGAAVAIPISFWLLAFSMFLFLSLALVKRYVELRSLPRAANGRAAGRGYKAVDLESMSQFGIASGYMAVLVLALYIDSKAVNLLYGHPEIIWFLCPLVLYLVSRIWLLARRGEMHDDPIVFALTDRRSQLIAVAGALLLVAATL
ncbi:MAG: UbiA family prenyltransferase [Pseudomonadota bacterium]|nr:UbiA family prenyltransferase [Pseudomonadota bacterium]